MPPQDEVRGQHKKTPFLSAYYRIRSLLLQSDYDPVFFFKVIGRATGGALQDVHGVKACCAGLAVYGVNGETVVFLGGELLDQSHVEVFLFLHDLSVDEIGVVHVKTDKEDQIISILHGKVQKLHGATVVDVDDVVKAREIRVASVDTHIGPVIGKNDGTEKRHGFSFEILI